MRPRRDKDSDVNAFSLNGIAPKRQRPSPTVNGKKPRNIVTGTRLRKEASFSSTSTVTGETELPGRYAASGESASEDTFSASPESDLDDEDGQHLPSSASADSSSFPTRANRRRSGASPRTNSKANEAIIARAKVDTTLAVIPAEAFRRLTKKFPNAAAHIVQGACEGIYEVV